MSTLNSAYASCPKFLELLLRDELLQLGAHTAQEKLAGVEFTADAETLMRVVLWSRLANRVMLQLHQSAVRNRDDLYRAVQAVDWPAQVRRLHSLQVRFNGTGAELKNTHFSAQVCKDAVCDQSVERSGQRPEVVRENADLCLAVRLKNGQAVIYQDLCAHSLHRRGHREQTTMAPLKENLAAAILLRAGWAEMAQGQANLIDPMCGSGTFLSEGWMIACDVAPGLNSDHNTLQQWRGFEAEHWAQLRAEAEQRKIDGAANYQGQIIGVDHHKKSIENARENLAAMAPEARIQCQYQPLERFRIPPRNNLVVCNPPYGLRLKQRVDSSWRALAEWLSLRAQGSVAAILTPDQAKGLMIGYRESQSWHLLNGGVDVWLRRYELRPENKLNTPDGQRFWLPADVQALANRLKKNREALQGWADANGVQAYRLYDADLPEYAAAIDVYKDRVLIQEYKAPKSIAARKARQRLAHIELAVQCVLQGEAEKVVVKTRQKQKGAGQYQKHSEETSRFRVHECGRQYWVDLHSYLDTGLFLDHRWLRNRLQSECRGRNVLNLFCYTGAITVAAALGGATSSHSVDTSKTYLAWAEDNFKLNRLDLKNHRLIRADVWDYLRSCERRYDVIVVDPPTFSNSHSRERDWDVQKDHADLLLACKALLKPGDVVYFSNNYSRFKLADAVHAAFHVDDLTAQSLDEDFANSGRVHWCFRLKLKES